MSTRHTLLLRLLLAAAAFVQSCLISAIVYQRVATGSDENSYVFQAHAFAEGRIARPYPPMADYFDQGMIILDEQAGWLSRYPPGHPLWLTPGVWLGGAYIMVALAAALGVWFTGAAAAQAGLSPLLAGLLLLLSPFFILMYGTHLSHTSGLVAVAAMLYGYQGWLRSGRWPWAALAGLAWSFFFLNRTYTALLMAIPFGLHAGWIWGRDRRWPVFCGVLAFAGCALVGVLAYLIYNKLAVGAYFTATYLYYAPTEGLGFGPRRLQGMHVMHTLERGLGFLREDLHRLDRWLFGWPGSLIAALLLGLAGWKRWTLLLISAAAAVWGGYVYFWFHGVTVAGGPAYYFETIPLLILLTTAGLQRLGSSLSHSTRARQLWAATALLLLAASTAHFLRTQTPPMIKNQKLIRSTMDVLHGVPTNALVLVHHLRVPHPSGMLFNPRGLDSDPLLMRSPEDDWAVALRVFPDRKAFVYDAKRPRQLQPLSPPEILTLERQPKPTAHHTGHRVKGMEPHGDGQEADASGGAPAGWLAMGRHLYLPRGTYRTTFEGSAWDIPPGSPSFCDVASKMGRLILFSNTLAGTVSGTLAQLELTVTNQALRIEPRVYFGGAGRLYFHRTVFTEIPEASLPRQRPIP